MSQVETFTVMVILLGALAGIVAFVNMRGPKC